MNPPYISCIVYACHPEVLHGGVVEMCRWDVKNNEWLKRDVKGNWFLTEPYIITHYCEDYNKPHDTPTRPDLAPCTQFEAEVQAMIDTLARIRRDAEAVPQLVRALRDLHDLQNGPPLERGREDWEEVMVRVAELLEKYETE